MKKKLMVLSFLLAFGVTAVLIGCSSNKPNTQNTPQQSNTANNATNNTTNNTANNTTSGTNQTFTLDQLKTYNGQNGQAAYVAVNGTVYDVTHARKWRNGQHEQGIVAGVDLTSAMPNSPHGTSVLNEVPVVGKLK